MDRITSFTSHSEQDTRDFASRMGKSLPKNSIVCFFGDLGAGKTTFIKGLAAEAAGVPEEEVNSPTFTYLNIYQGTQTVYHFDLYRLHDTDEFLSMGFDEYFEDEGICCIEWSERIAPLLPPNCIQVIIRHLGESLRNIEIRDEDLHFQPCKIH